VTEVLTYYEGHPEPIPAKNSSPSTEENTGENEEPLSEDSEIDQEFNAEEDFRICGEKIANLLKDGQEITDEIYVQLYVAKLRLTYPHKSKKELRRELRVKVTKQRDIKKKIEPLQKELQEIHDAAQLNASDETINTQTSKPNKKKKHSRDAGQIQAKIEELNKEIEKIDDLEKNGWILIDFPSTFV